MTLLPIGLPYRNADPYAILNNLYLAQDCYLVSLGGGHYAIHKRPGLSSFVDTGTERSIDGVYWFNEQKCLIVCSDGNVDKYTDKFGTKTRIGTNVLEKNTRVTFCKVADSANSNTVTLFMANGGNIVYTTGSSCTQLTGANIPTRVTHVLSLNTYLACNDLDNPTKWKTSDAGTPKTFSSNFTYSAQALTDKINGLYQNKGKIWVTGENSIEPHYDTGLETPFNPITGGLVETGLVNSYSITKVNNDVIFLNGDRDIINLPDGSASSQIISDSYANRIQTLSSINDVEVDYIGGIGGRKFVLFNFNDAHISLVYDYNLKCFYEWGWWNTDENEYEQFRGRCYTYCPDWNLHIIGDRENGLLYKMSEDYTTDNGDYIRTEIITGNYNFNSTLLQRNQIKRLYLHTRRGDGKSSDTATAPKCYLQYKQNFTNSWANQIEIDLGAIGQVAIPNQGLGGFDFNTIQFRILHMDDSKFVLNGIYYE